MELNPIDLSKRIPMQTVDVLDDAAETRLRLRRDHALFAMPGQQGHLAASEAGLARHQDPYKSTGDQSPHS